MNTNNHYDQRYGNNNQEYGAGSSRKSYQDYNNRPATSTYNNTPHHYSNNNYNHYGKGDFKLPNEIRVSCQSNFGTIVQLVSQVLRD